MRDLQKYCFVKTVILTVIIGILSAENADLSTLSLETLLFRDVSDIYVLNGLCDMYDILILFF